MSGVGRWVPKLREIVGEANVVQDDERLKTLALDGKRPRLIVSPKTIEEVSKVVLCAREGRLTVTPRGHGTKMEVGGTPRKMDIILSTTRLNRITDCDCDNLTLSAECGAALGEVQKNLAGEGRGYFLPLDPPYTAKATLGGIMATNSSGPRRLLYGTARDLVIGMKVVLPNGDIVVSGGKTVKNVSGYDLCKLMIGSLGTLGIMCEFTLKLLPLPEKEATLLFSFVTWEGADVLVQQISRSQLLPASMVILNALATQKIKAPGPMPDAGYLVAVGLEGVAEGVDRQISAMGEMGKAAGAQDVLSLFGDVQRKFWTALRDFHLGIAQGIGGETDSEGSSLVLKMNVLISKSGVMLGSCERILREVGLEGALICHGGSGILYSYLPGGRKLRSKTPSVVDFIGRLTSEAVKNEGNLVVESAPPAIKKKVDVWGQRRGDYPIMRRLKDQIDPEGILNPGRFVGGI
jgi:glycolate oxidase FAD binding subunit